jgi:hypothetical protein
MSGGEGESGLEGAPEDMRSKPKSFSSMFSLLNECAASQAPNRGNSAVVLKKVVPQPQPESPALVKRVAPVHSRKLLAHKVPDWQGSLAHSFLLTPDYSFSDSEVACLGFDCLHFSDPCQNRSNGPSEIDQITEETTRCICNSTHESEVMIQCDSCKKWLHEDCVRLQNSREVDPFLCIFCQYEMSTAVKGYLRKKMTAFGPILSRFGGPDLGRGSGLWSELLEVVRDSQEVLRMIPSFLPATEEDLELY